MSSISPNGFTVLLVKYGLEGFIPLNSDEEKAHQKRIREEVDKDPEHLVNVNA